MAAPKLTVQINPGIGREALGEDHISGLLFYVAVLPSGFSAFDEVKQYSTLQDAEADGIIEGSASYGVIWYQIKEFFRVAPTSRLYVCLGDIPSPASTAADFAELPIMQAAANGKIRQFGAFVDFHVMDPADIVAMNAALQTMEGEFQGAVGILAPNTVSVATASLVDLRASLTAQRVMVVVGQDGDNDGAALATSTAKSVPALGAALGALSRGNPAHSIGWVAQYNMSENTQELGVPALGNGDLVKDLSLAAIDTLSDKGYLFLRNHQNTTGSFFQDNPTATVSTSDFAYVAENKVIQKAIRQVHAAYTPALNSPISLQADGTLTPDAVSYWESLAERALRVMERNAEISAFDVSVDPAQDVLTTSQICVEMAIVPIGTARTIKLSIGFTTSVA